MPAQKTRNELVIVAPIARRMMIQRPDLRPETAQIAAPPEEGFRKPFAELRFGFLRSESVFMELLRSVRIAYF